MAVVHPVEDGLCRPGGPDVDNWEQIGTGGAAPACGISVPRQMPAIPTTVPLQKKAQERGECGFRAGIDESGYGLFGGGSSRDGTAGTNSHRSG